MKSTLDCIPCFVSHTLHVAKMVTDDPAVQASIVKTCLSEISKMDMERTPPEMARVIHAVIRSTTGVDDAYLKIKDESTAFALKLLPQLREDVAKASDKFEAVVRLVIAGNIIDFGADRHFKLETAHHRILEALDAPVDTAGIARLKKAMDHARNILYLADNCGEAVIDRLLIELYAGKITVAVRGYPILNDVTRREAEMSGLDSLARIVDTGDATPGVSMRHSSPEFLEEFRRADLIISKGQGNFETLNDTDRPIFFLFRAKCSVISALLGDAALGSLHVIARNL
ncbi:MAG: hypothetical protein A2X49_02610 [Lentisphaerae bacterium GWF2_52_8]|nr:MAG: hypothetical protein A2X49_02610 [Lentisphaerae bacterium GWF2_52_8]